MWQLDELHVTPDIELLKNLHECMCGLLNLQFSQTEVITGNYSPGRIMKAGLKNWMALEREIREYRGREIFDFASFMLYSDKQETDGPVSNPDDK